MRHYEFEISQYVEGELPQNKIEELLSHLSKCKKCSKTLNEYKRIKNNISDFYSALPTYTNNDLRLFNGNFSPKRNTAKIWYTIPFAIALSLILIFVLFTNENSIKHKTVEKKSFTGTRQTENIIAEKFFSLSVHNYEAESSLNYYNNIKRFNKIIDKAIEEREKRLISSQLINTGYHLTQKEFNEGINSILYPSN